jgi:Predicted transcriptional regulators
MKASSVVSDTTIPVNGAAEAPPLHTSAIPEGELRTIPIGELYESPDNPRQHYPEAAMSELVESMKQSGFRPWLPLLVRPCGQSSAIWRKLGDVSGYEIGAGHRRRRAAELAGISAHPLHRHVDDRRAVSRCPELR